MSLSKCLKKVGLSKYEAEILRGNALDYREEGVEALTAARKAIDDRIEELGRDRAAIVDQIVKAGGEVPEAAPAARTLQARLAEPEIGGQLRQMAEEAGWLTLPGRLMREGGKIGEGTVIGRTSGETRSEWFRRMRQEMGRSGLVEQGQIRQAVTDALEGRQLSPRAARTVDWMLSELEDFNRAWANQPRLDDPFGADIALRDEGLDRAAAIDFGRVAEAARIDDGAVERAALQFENDDAGFRSRIEEIIRGRDQEGQQGREDQPGTPRAATAGVPEVRGEARPADTGTGGGRGGPEGLRPGVEPPQRLGADEGRPAARPAGERPELALEQPTPEGLRARSDVETRAAREQAAKDKAPPPEDFTLTGSERPADEARARGQGELYGGVPAPVARAVGEAFGSSRQWAEGIGFLVQQAKDLRSAPRASRTPRVFELVRHFFDSSSGDIRGELKRWDSPTANRVVDQLHAVAGEGRAQGAVFLEAVADWANQQKNRLARAFEGLSAEELDQAIRQVRAGQPVTKAAKAIRAVLDDALKYMREAGVELGEILNYYPREFDLRRVVADTEGFIRALTQAYVETGQAASQADMSARALAQGLLYGDAHWFDPRARNTSAPFLKERVFGPQVDQPAHPLNKFLMGDPVHGLATYLHRAAQRAEIARRFGDRFSRWDEIVNKIRDEGAGEIVPALKDYVALATGVRNVDAGRTGARVSSFLRSWGSLMLLEKATLASLQETIMPAIRTGNLLDVGRSLSRSVEALFRTASHAERKAYAEDLGLISASMMDNAQMERWTGGDVVSSQQARVLTRFYRGTGLTALTNAQIAIAADMGRIFLRRLAKDGGKLDKRYLAELGVPEAKAAEFSKWLLSKHGGLPRLGDLEGEMGGLYHTAISRFAKQTIMQPNVSLRPAWHSTHPVGKVIGQIQAFNYAFWENVLKRGARGAREALTGEGYTLAERGRLMMPMLMLPLLAVGGAAVGEARDALLGDPNWRAKEGDWQKIVKAFSRGTPIAPIDPILNFATSAKYRQTAAKLIIGPAPGTLVTFLDALIQYAANNSENTNAAERTLAKRTWDVFIEPTLQMALLGTPLSPMWGVVRIAGPGNAQIREEFVKALAGPENKGGKKPVF